MGLATVAFVPGTEFLLEHFQKMIHAESEGGQECEVRIDDAHVQQLGLQSNAVTKTDIAHQHLRGSQENHGGPNHQPHRVNQLGKNITKNYNADYFQM